MSGATTVATTVATFSGIDTYHVQGISRFGDTVFISTTDKRSRSGYLLKIDIAGGHGRLITSLPLKNEGRIHPGGITRDGDRILVPLAHTRDQPDTFMLSVDASSLAVDRLFAVPTHIGAVATNGSGTLFGADFDTKRLFVWSSSGTETAVIANPTTIAYQDMEWHGDRLYCSGVDKRDRTKGRVDVYSYADSTATLSLEQSLPLPAIDRKTNLGREGMTIYSDSFLFLPEDDEHTTLYAFSGPTR